MCTELPQEVASFAEDILRNDTGLSVELLSADAIRAGLLLNTRTRENDEDGFSEDNYWGRLQDEMYRFLCTNDPHYKELRNKLTDAKFATSRFVIPAISATIGNMIGLAAGMITPFVALALLTIFKVGTSAWCSAHARPRQAGRGNDSKNAK